MRVRQTFFNMFGQGTISYELDEQVTNPNHAHRVMIHSELKPNFTVEGMDTSIVLEVDGVRKTLFARTYSHDDLMDAYEEAHHRTHGYDARGLDPREGRTRLKP